MSAPHAHPDHYAALGVPTTATARQITHAYRALIRALHPDTATASGDTGTRFTAVTTAYQVLHDPDRRAAYDQARHSAPPAPRPPGIRTALHVTVHTAPPADAVPIAGPAPPATRAPLLRAGPVRVSPLPSRAPSHRGVGGASAHPRPPEP